MVSEKKILKVYISKIYFSTCDLNMQRILKNIKEGHIRIIPAKFGQNQDCSYGGESFEAIVDDGRRATDIQGSQ